MKRARTTSARACGVSLLGLLAWACAGGSSTGEPPAPTLGALPPGVAAMVGDDAIDVETVERVAVAQHLSPSDARDRAVNDALFAAGARDRFGPVGVVSTARRAALARGLLEETGGRPRAKDR